MEAVNIEYRIKLSENRTEVFEYELDGATFDLVTEEIADPPPWAELTYHQCEHCPLDPDEHSHCPVALQLHSVVDRFHDTRSIDEVELEVITETRRVSQTVAIQHALASILGLTSPICGCPKTAFMKPMARFHLPLASEEETVFRVTGMYLLAQYFLNRDDRESEINFDGLIKIYEDLHVVNKAIAGRLTSFTQSDSVKNAITLLDMYSILVPVLLEDELVEMRTFFEAFLKGAGPIATSNNLQQAKVFSMELTPMEERKRSDAPSWLKDVTVVGDTSKEKPDDQDPPEPSPVDAADEILARAGLDSMQLEPIEEDGEEDNHGGKAVFILPDD